MMAIHKGGDYPPVAKLVNSNTAVAVLRDYADTVSALSQATLPSGAALKYGIDYVPAMPNPTVGYPIVGYSTWIMPTCYTTANDNVVNGIYEFFALIYSDPDYISLIQQRGFVQLPAAVVTILNYNIFYNNNGYDIDLDDANICQSGGATMPVAGFLGSPYPGR
jgi:hypothetical protein